MNEEAIKEKLHKQIKEINWDKAMNCPICREWIVLCANTFGTKEEVAYKDDYWDKYKVQLKSNGFSDETMVSLTEYEKECIEDLDGVVLFFRIGTEEKPATNNTLQKFAKTVEKLNSNKTKVIIVPHTVQLEKVNLPTLKRIENKLLTDKTESCVVDIDELL